MKKSESVRLGLLTSVAAALAGCTSHVHFDQYGRCVSDSNGAIVSPNVCNSGAHAGGGAYYYGGSRYSYTPSSSGTVRGVFGESAGHSSSSDGSGAGE